MLGPQWEKQHTSRSVLSAVGWLDFNVSSRRWTSSSRRNGGRPFLSQGDQSSHRFSWAVGGTPTCLLLVIRVNERRRGEEAHTRCAARVPHVTCMPNTRGIRGCGAGKREATAEGGPGAAAPPTATAPGPPPCAGGPPRSGTLPQPRCGAGGGLLTTTYYDLLLTCYLLLTADPPYLGAA